MWSELQLKMFRNRTKWDFEHHMGQLSENAAEALFLCLEVPSIPAPLWRWEYAGIPYLRRVQRPTRDHDKRIAVLRNQMRSLAIRLQNLIEKIEQSHLLDQKPLSLVLLALAPALLFGISRFTEIEVIKWTILPITFLETLLTTKRPGISMNPEHISIHSTGNPSSTAWNDSGNWLTSPLIKVLLRGTSQTKKKQ